MALSSTASTAATASATSSATAPASSATATASAAAATAAATVTTAAASAAATASAAAAASATAAAAAAPVTVATAAAGSFISYHAAVYPLIRCSPASGGKVPRFFWYLKYHVCNHMATKGKHQLQAKDSMSLQDTTQHTTPPVCA